MGTLNEELSPGCTTDTLYSWDHWGVVQDMKARLPDNEPWSGNPVAGDIAKGTLFVTLSPSATFGYGTTLIRIKLKPKTPFVIGFWGQPAPGKVTVGQDGYNDITITDSSLIESWSYGTPEIYDEIVRDVLRYQSGARAFAYNGMKYPTGAGIQRLYNQASDGHLMNEDLLKGKLLSLIKGILSGEGGVFYNEGSCRNRDLSYSTNDPNYIIPLSSKDLKLPVH